MKRQQARENACARVAGRARHARALPLCAASAALFPHSAATTPRTPPLELPCGAARRLRCGGGGLFADLKRCSAAGQLHSLRATGRTRNCLCRAGGASAQSTPQPLHGARCDAPCARHSAASWRLRGLQGASAAGARAGQTPSNRRGAPEVPEHLKNSCVSRREAGAPRADLVMSARAAPLSAGVAPLPRAARRRRASARAPPVPEECQSARRRRQPDAVLARALRPRAPRGLPSEACPACQNSRRRVTGGSSLRVAPGTGELGVRALAASSLASRPWPRPRCCGAPGGAVGG